MSFVVSTKTAKEKKKKGEKYVRHFLPLVSFPGKIHIGSIPGPPPTQSPRRTRPACPRHGTANLAISGSKVSQRRGDRIYKFRRRAVSALESKVTAMVTARKKVKKRKKKKYPAIIDLVNITALLRRPQ